MLGVFMLLALNYKWLVKKTTDERCLWTVADELCEQYDAKQLLKSLFSEINELYLTWPEDMQKSFRILELAIKDNHLIVRPNFGSDALYTIIRNYEKTRINHQDES